MDQLQTPATMIAAAKALLPMVATLASSSDTAKQDQGQVLAQKIDDAVEQAQQLAAQDVINLLAAQNGPFKQLQALDAQAKTAAAAIAAQEAQVDAAISFATSVAKFAGAVVTANPVAAATELSTMLSSLGIQA